MANAASYVDLQRESQFRHLTRWLTRTVYAIADSNPRFRRARWLQERSDAELAVLSIPRDEIVHHAFRDAYYR